MHASGRHSTPPCEHAAAPAGQQRARATHQAWKWRMHEGACRAGAAGLGGWARGWCGWRARGRREAGRKGLWLGGRAAAAVGTMRGCARARAWPGQCALLLVLALVLALGSWRAGRAACACAPAAALVVHGLAAQGRLHGVQAAVSVARQHGSAGSADAARRHWHQGAARTGRGACTWQATHEVRACTAGCNRWGRRMPMAGRQPPPRVEARLPALGPGWLH